MLRHCDTWRQKRQDGEREQCLTSKRESFTDWWSHCHDFSAHKGHLPPHVLMFACLGSLLGFTLWTIQIQMHTETDGCTRFLPLWPNTWRKQTKAGWFCPMVVEILMQTSRSCWFKARQRITVMGRWRRRLVISWWTRSREWRGWGPVIACTVIHLTTYLLQWGPTF